VHREINAVLARMAEGDVAALGELYELLSVRLFNYARAITGSRETAEDVTHDVFLQAYKQAARLAGFANPAAYLMTAARNRSLDCLRQSKRAGAALEDAPETGEAFPDDRLHIRDAFARLPASRRETVYLHYICGYTQKEVAGIMGVPLVTVRWRCKKAMSQLREYFSADGEGS
jgi:RNA polymerase sigma-70 factor (ECF subfamily)